MTTIESLKSFPAGGRDRVLALKNQLAIGNPAWFVAEGERQAYQAAIDELKRLEAANFAEFHQAFEAAHPGKAAEIRAAFEGAGEGNAGMRMSETIDGWEVVAIEPGLWCLRRPGYSAEIQASADGDNIDIADDAGRRWLYPPIAAIERLLALRRAALAPEDPLAAGVRSLVAGLDAIRARALAPEAQAPSGGPWRPAVGDLCLYYFGRSWLLARRIADQGNPEDDSDQEAFPQRFETIDAKTGCGYLYCDATYDGIRPLGSLPVPPSCGGEAEPWGRADRPAVASERPGLARLLEWADTMLGNEREAPREYPEGREDAFTDFVHEIEREIAALGPPSIAGQGIDDSIRAAESRRGDFGQGGPESYSDYSRGWRDGLAELRTILKGRELPLLIAEDLRTPEPGAFEGAELVGGDDQLEREIEALAREVTLGDRNRAVREALAELRGILTRERAADNLSYLGIALAVQELDEFAERFKP